MIGDVALLLVDTACLLVAATAGAVVHARRAGRPERPRDPNLMCGCEHELAYHDPATRVCSATETVRNGSTVYREIVQACPCKVYTGDLPADWYARIITGERA